VVPAGSRKDSVTPALPAKDLKRKSVVANQLQTGDGHGDDSTSD
jgi:hypothetical protein